MPDDGRPDEGPPPAPAPAPAWPQSRWGTRPPGSSPPEGWGPPPGARPGTPAGGSWGVPPGGPAPWAPAPPTNKTAIVSLVFGCAQFILCGIGAIVAIVTGVIPEAIGSEVEITNGRCPP